MSSARWSTRPARCAEPAAVLNQAGAGRQTEELATAWAQRFSALVALIRDGAPQPSETFAVSLSYPSPYAVRLPAVAVQDVTPWPDTSESSVMSPL
jgi:hypothetical protein